MTPPAAPRCSTASCVVGVVASPMSMTSRPAAFKPAQAASRTMGPVTRGSGPVATGPSPGRTRANAAEKRATTAGSSESPTTPRTPATEIMSWVLGMTGDDTRGPRRRQSPGRGPDGPLTSAGDRRPAPHRPQLLHEFQRSHDARTTQHVVDGDVEAVLPRGQGGDGQLDELPAQRAGARLLRADGHARVRPGTHESPVPWRGMLGQVVHFINEIEAGDAAGVRGQAVDFEVGVEARVFGDS